MYSLRLGSTRLGVALGRIGGGRSVAATANAAAPVPGDQGVGMDPAKQQQPHAPEGKQQDDMHKTQGDVMTDSFGAGYWTRSEEEGFGGVYGQNDPELYDASQGSEAEEKEKLNDDKHAA